MAGLHRLTVKQIEAQKARGRLSDGGGLFLQVTDWKGVVSRSWEFRFTLHGKTRSMGLGPFGIVSLKDARAEAEALRNIVRQNKDPIEERKSTKVQAQLEAEKSVTFAEAMEDWNVNKAGGFKNDRHRQTWRSSLEAYALPVIGKMKVADITMQDVLRVLNQKVDEETGATFWEARTETASRLRGRIEAVLSRATVAGYRTGDNPARWVGNLKEMLPAPSKIAVSANYPSLSQSDLPEWFAELRKREGVAARALELAALCASRSGEVRGAVWSEIDLEAKVWRIPGERMKAEKDHRVPLSPEAITLLEALPRVSGNEYVFPAAQGGMLSDMALSMLMRKMNAKEVKAGRKGWLDAVSGRAAVPHGLRSSFRVWTAERGYDRDMAEMALAHNVASKVERTYQRSDMIERRRAMMTDWGRFLAGEVASGVVMMMADRQGGAA